MDTATPADPGKLDYSKSNVGVPKSTPAPAPAPKPMSAASSSMDTAKTDYQQNPDQKNVSWSAPKPVASSAPKSKEAGTPTGTVAESVKVGGKTYRIV